MSSDLRVRGRLFLCVSLVSATLQYKKYRLVSFPDHHEKQQRELALVSCWYTVHDCVPSFKYILGEGLEDFW